MAVNLKGMMLVSKHAIPKMIEAGGGSIINIASIDGLRANIWQNIPYAVSKGGAVSLTHNMAVHHGRDNIRVNCIAPGHIYAPMTTTISDELRDLRRRSGPLGTEGTAWDIAWAGLFLASDESRWISGVLLPVDAGLLATTPLAMLSHLQ
jgi:NAD(P)-dependent dehydrogenase (short-subunit alcohol dehydrogenase family)